MTSVPRHHIGMAIPAPDAEPAASIERGVCDGVGPEYARRAVTRGNRQT